MAIGVAVPALPPAPPPPPSPAAQRRSSHKPRRRTDNVEVRLDDPPGHERSLNCAKHATGQQLASAPPLRSKVRKPSISPIRPPCASPTAHSNSSLPTTSPAVPHCRSSHKGGDHMRPRNNHGHSSPTYATHDQSKLFSEHQEGNDDCRMSVHAEAATVLYEPDRPPSSVLLRYPYACMVPPTPRSVDACKGTSSDLKGGCTFVADSEFSGGEQPSYRNPAAAVFGGYRRNDAVAGLKTGPFQSGCAVPRATPLDNQTQSRDNEAALAAQLRYVSDRVWPYSGSAYDQNGYTEPALCMKRSRYLTLHRAASVQTRTATSW
ncbi:hypothetical protein C8Q77DRAFT_125634 [Trametes polyzona]|nr:hypothetical protein C8Q77DRAFT_125634 [Trametes polyzona]